MKHSISNSASPSPDINPEAGAASSNRKRLAGFCRNAASASGVMGLKQGLSHRGAGGGGWRWRARGSRSVLEPPGPRAVGSEAYPRSGQQLVAVPVCAGPSPVPLPVSITHSCLYSPCQVPAVCFGLSPETGRFSETPCRPHPRSAFPRHPS